MIDKKTFLDLMTKKKEERHSIFKEFDNFKAEDIISKMSYQSAINDAIEILFPKTNICGVCYKEFPNDVKGYYDKITHVWCCSIKCRTDYISFEDGSGG
ncbi:hypothetical protein M0R19_04795 [Candidatus Pacearchaeota archaeon]|jgi:hypothetical protein|nr:hypothetical protein [Candidatus Pacearchaeota archaeon]